MIAFRDWVNQLYYYLLPYISNHNKTLGVIVKVITDYDYIYSGIDYDYIAPGNGDYDYLTSCNRVQSITITDYDYLNPAHQSDVLFSGYMS